VAALGAPEAIGVFVIVAVVAELVRALELRRVSAPTRMLLRDDNRARRLRPRSWDWAWPTRLRPWWWVLLTQLPPPLLLAANAVFLALALAGGVVFWIVALGLGLPFSVRRSWHWYRRRRPGAGSWRPPA
jgi:hypothetical protein